MAARTQQYPMGKVIAAPVPAASGNEPVKFIVDSV
jgi:hypothetical protein